MLWNAKWAKNLFFSFSKSGGTCPVPWSFTYMFESIRFPSSDLLVRRCGGLLALSLHSSGYERDPHSPLCSLINRCSEVENTPASLAAPHPRLEGPLQGIERK